MLDHDRVAALGDDARAVDAQAGELAEDGGDVRPGRGDPAERGTVHHQLNVLVEHLAPRVEVTVVETLVEAGDKRSEVLHGQRRPIGTGKVSPDHPRRSREPGQSSHQNAITATSRGPTGPSTDCSAAVARTRRHRPGPSPRPAATRRLPHAPPGGVHDRVQDRNRRAHLPTNRTRPSHRPPRHTGSAHCRSPARRRSTCSSSRPCSTASAGSARSSSQTRSRPSR